MQATDWICRDPGHAYVVVPEIWAGNRCARLASHPDQTFTFGPGRLSTIRAVRDGGRLVTSVFDFADLPCPPKSVLSDYSQVFEAYAGSRNFSSYAPFVAPFSLMNELDFVLPECTVARFQGIDPPTALPKATGVTPPHGPLGIHGGHHQRGLPQNAHRVSQGPRETNPANQT